MVAVHIGKGFVSLCILEYLFVWTVAMSKWWANYPLQVIPFKCYFLKNNPNTNSIWHACVCIDMYISIQLNLQNHRVLASLYYWRESHAHGASITCWVKKYILWAKYIFAIYICLIYLGVFSDLKVVLHLGGSRYHFFNGMVICKPLLFLGNLNWKFTSKKHILKKGTSKNYKGNWRIPEYSL